MNRVRTTLYTTIGFLLIAGTITSVCAEDKFTQADRERMVRMEATLTVFMQQMDKRLEQVDKRFEQVDKRFEQVDKRFEQVDKRFEELRADMNSRFEQVDKRFEQMTNMFYTLSGIFTSLFAMVFGFAWWDRRTVLTSAKKAARKEVKLVTEDIRQSMVTQRKLIDVLKEFAEKTPDLKDLMSRAHLL